MSRHLLWIGAGAAQTPDFDYTKYTKVILVDPLLQSESLEQLNNNEKFVSVVKGVTTESVGNQSFKLFNNEEFSSFLEPVGLKQIYPNLVQEEILDVETTSISQLIKEHQVTGYENTLFLDVPCLAEEILNELKTSNILRLFHEVYITAGKQPLYRNGGDINTITELLDGMFYQFVSGHGNDVDVRTYNFEFNPLLESVQLQKEENLDLQAQLKLVVNTHQELVSEKEELETLLSNSQLAFSEVQTELHTVNETVAEQKLANNELQSQLKTERDRSTILQQNIETLRANEEVNLNKLRVLESDLQAENKKLEDYVKQVNELNSERQALKAQLVEAESDVIASKAAVKQLESQLHEEQSQSKQLTELVESLQVELQAKSNNISSLEAELSSVSNDATVRIDTLTKENEKLISSLGAEKVKADKAQANENDLRSTLVELQIRHKQDSDSYTNEIHELKTKLNESEKKYKETYGWFASRKQQAEALTVEVEALKRENSLLASNNETALAISQLENKLTSMLNKQSDESIEIANALGKHVTRCHEEQKSNISSQFELRKLSALSRLPISISSQDMDSSNLAELSSLVSHNVYDVIIEFGSGLSTVVSASVLQDKAGRGVNNDKLLRDESDSSYLENVLPKHIVSFEQSSERLQKTATLLADAGVEAYVDLCHTPMVSVPLTENSTGGELFYDCSEKLLELKRILSNRKANILAIVNGPQLNSDTDKEKYWALPLVLDYLSQCNITFFIDNTNVGQLNNLVKSWEGECMRRHLTANVEKIKTPNGVTMIAVQS
ncbi:MAG: hypothetical protein KYX63_00675 [Alteromonas macleodii]|nr:hypothetical protein [Alteromonas macleodii]